MNEKYTLFATRRLPARIEERIAHSFQAVFNTEDRPLNAEEILANAKEADAIVCTPADRFDADLINALPKTLKALGAFSVGTDHIDLSAAAARRLPVCNAPDVLSVATAECAMLLILAAARRAGEGERLVRSGHWTGWAPTQLLGAQVSGRSLGIFGMGRIGRVLAGMARGFGMTVHYRNRRRLPPDLECDAVYHHDDASFLAASEVLSLHAPSDATTRSWLNANRISLLPPGAIVVNTARGSLVDDTALIAALKTRKLFAAGLDVFNDEPNLNSAYLTLPNVFLLPHLGSATETTREKMGHLVLDGIEAILSGRTPANLVRSESP